MLNLKEVLINLDHAFLNTNKLPVFNKNDIENLHNFTKWKTKYNDTEKYKDIDKFRIGYFAEFFLEKLE